ncbi:MAG: DUF805 domain-containing protein, partial [Elusimicrobiota bacterium]|nr:DUF805 domain-containing protein [Elusimicrobiota bacterium]
ADFRGRASRKQFWSFILIAVVLYLLIPSLIFIISLILDKGDFAYKVSAYICAAILLTPILSIISRRLRDSGHSPAWQFIFYIPVFTFFIFFLLLLHLASQTEEFEGLLSNPAASFFAISAVISAISAFIGLIILICFLLSSSKKNGIAADNGADIISDIKYKGIADNKVKDISDSSRADKVDNSGADKVDNSGADKVDNSGADKVDNSAYMPAKKPSDIYDKKEIK